MHRDPIRRQHETTTIPELSGAICTEFRAVFNAASGFYGPFYIRLEDIWHRFYLDAALVFWEQGPSPDPDNDLLNDDEYVDMATALAVCDVAVEAVRMHDGQLAIDFRNGARFGARHGVQDEGTTVLLV